jgi:hypothetical protein
MAVPAVRERGDGSICDPRWTVAQAFGRPAYKNWGHTELWQRSPKDKAAIDEWRLSGHVV